MRPQDETRGRRDAAQEGAQNLLDRGSLLEILNELLPEDDVDKVVLRVGVDEPGDDGDRDDNPNVDRGGVP